MDAYPPGAVTTNQEGTTYGDPRYLAAITAWTRVGRGLVGIQAPAVEVLKDDGESLVLRLCKFGPGGSDVIAKQAGHQRLVRQFDAQSRVVRSWYQSTEAVGIRRVAPSCYGLLQMDGGSWLFEEDVGGVRLRKKQAEHRRLVSRLIGTIHRSFAGRPIEGLPPAGPRRHRVQLEAALVSLRSTVKSIVGSPELTSDRVSRLRELLQALESTRLGWGQVEAACSGMPETLVHGDLQAKNVRVVGSGNDQFAVILDWERIGWGVPAIDLADCVDLNEYGSVVQERWKNVSVTGLHRWRQVGRLFRHIFWLQWALGHLQDALAPRAWLFLEDRSYDEYFRAVDVLPWEWHAVVSNQTRDGP